MSKWDYLDEEYEDYRAVEKIQKNMNPAGSLTDNLRLAEPKRNGAHKRVYRLARKLKHPQS